MTRPPVAVVVPFHGSRAEAAAALELLGALRLRDGDEAVLADNTPDHVAASLPVPPGVRVLACEARQTAYGARNEGIDATTQPWVALLDADCRPVPELLDRFFEPPPGERTGAVAGEVGGVPGQPGLVPRYARDRRHLDQERLLTAHVLRPMAVTANLLVRRDAWEEVGGFAEHVRSGGDGDFCWRLQEAGWALELRREARAPHEHRPDVGAMLRKALRDGAANPWLAARWPGFPVRVGVVRQALRAAAAVPVWILRARPERAAFKVLDVLWSIATDAGTLMPNGAPAPPVARDGRATVVVAEAPRRGQPLPSGARVEALRRPVAGHDWRVGRRTDLRLAEDDGAVTRARALAGIAARRPLAVARAARRSWALTWRLAPAAARVRRSGGPVADGGDAAAAAVLRRLSGR